MALMQSEVAATRTGIQALNSAEEGLKRIRMDVENTRHNLTQGYGGDDGGAFQKLVEDWERQCDKIIDGVRTMGRTLEDTLTAQGQQQSTSFDEIGSTASQSQAVFETLK